MKSLVFYISVFVFLSDSLKIKGAYYDVKVEHNSTGLNGKHQVNKISKNLNGFIPAFNEPKKIALIIAIGSYNEQETGWKAINSKNDIALIRSALVKKGFLNENIFIIQDAACTKTGIKNVIRTKLIDHSMPGDIIYLHYSGHGHQIYDTSGDEADGFDEALVPIDASNLKKKAFKPEKYLLDDEVGTLLTAIRSKVGPSGEVIFTMEACHSGTVTRVDPTIISIPKDHLEMDAEVIKKEINGYIEMPSLVEKNLNLAPFIVFSSASYNEVSSETFDDNNKPVGPLSYAFSKAFASAKAKSTYRVLFQQIKSIMSDKVPLQTPQVEGNTDRLILGGRETAR